MGIVVSRFKSQKDDNYEKILSELDDNIRKAEISLGEIRIRERNALIIWIVYSLLAYIAYVIGYWYFIYMSNEGENWDFMKVAPVLTGPFFIVIGYRFLALWYRRKETNEISQLEGLRAQQSLKVEELKKKTGYYTTKTLLERYDSPTKLPINQQPMSPGQKNPLKPGTPNSLRQRLPPPPPPPNNNNSNTNTNINTNSNSNNNGVINSSNIDQQIPRSSSSPSINNLPNQPRHWYDKLVDVIVGEDEQKYALICKDCYTWNGLAFAADYDDLQYYCKNCNHFNPSRRSLRNGTASAPALLSQSVTSSLSQPSSLSTNNNNNNNNLSSSSNGNLDASIDSLSPRRGRSTTPKQTSRDSSSDPEKSKEKYDDYDDDGVAVSKRLASRSTSRKRKGSHHRDSTENDDNEDFEDNRFKPYNVKDEIDHDNE